MRFFTLETYARAYRDDDDAPLRAAFARYAEHRERLRNRLPEAVLALAALPGTDDALVSRVRRGPGRLVLVLRCGDLVTGYHDLEIVYGDALVDPEHDRTLAGIARTTRGHRRHACDLFLQEVDCDDRGIVHRLLFHPGVWFEIRCARLNWRLHPRPDRRLPPMRDRYPEGPPDPFPIRGLPASVP